MTLTTLIINQVAFSFLSSIPLAGNNINDIKSIIEKIKLHMIV